MAALAGCLILDAGAVRPQSDLVRRLCAMQGHRGADPVRVVAAGEAMVAASGLPLTDPSPEGLQPMQEEADGDLVVCLDGLIVNQAALRAEARGAGLRLPHPLRHRSGAARLRRLGRGLPRPARRHVRARRPRPAPPTAAARARPPRAEAVHTV